MDKPAIAFSVPQFSHLSSGCDNGTSPWWVGECEWCPQYPPSLSFPHDLPSWGRSGFTLNDLRGKAKWVTACFTDGEIGAQRGRPWVTHKLVAELGHEPQISCPRGLPLHLPTRLCPASHLQVLDRDLVLGGV